LVLDSGVGNRGEVVTR